MAGNVSKGRSNNINELLSDEIHNRAQKILAEKVDKSEFAEVIGDENAGISRRITVLEQENSDMQTEINDNTTTLRKWLVYWQGYWQSEGEYDPDGGSFIASYNKFVDALNNTSNQVFFVIPEKLNEKADKAYADEIKDIAEKRTKGVVFDTKAIMDEWLKTDENKVLLNSGDHLYIRDTDTPDYWWDGKNAVEVKAQKVYLEDYLKSADYAADQKERANAHAILEQAINNEVDTRQNDVSKLNNKIDKEITDRTEAINKITGMSLDITEEKNERIIKDKELSSKIEINLDKISELESSKADKATTLEGYNIENAYTKDEINKNIYTKNDINAMLKEKADKSTTLKGYGIEDAYTKAETDAEINTIKSDVAENKDGLLALANDRAPYEYVKEELAKKASIDYVESKLVKKADLWNDEGGFIGGDLSTAHGKAISIGYGASANGKGISIGEGTVSGGTNGISIGNKAKTYDSLNNAFVNAIQLGEGTNESEGTFQVYDYQLLDADGNIPAARIPKLIEHDEAIKATVDAIDGAYLNMENKADKADVKYIEEQYNTAIGAIGNIDVRVDEKADKAYVDEQLGDISTALDEKADKPTISTSSDTEYIFDLADNHNKEIRLTAVLSSISFNIPAELNDDYISSLSFSTGDAELPINYPSGGVINWIGTDCSVSDGISNFIPSPNMHYDIVFYYNGSSVVGMVNGFVPAEVRA